MTKIISKAEVSLHFALLHWHKNNTLIRDYLLIAICLIKVQIHAQEAKKYQYRSVIFYNVENLFDTYDDPATLDESFLPEGQFEWNRKRYLTKLKHIARVIGEFGPEGSGKGADLIGICEVENSAVLLDLLNNPIIRKQNYKVIHMDSPDRRGIDVALIYRGSCFQPINFQNHPLKIYNEHEYREYSRDQLVVQGLLDGEEMFFIINHWPSRRGGELKSKPFRRAAAQLTKELIDSIRQEVMDPKIIIMGDFNDNPLNDSFKITLKTTGNSRASDQQHLFNPMELLYRKGVGSLAYRDRWELFDQIIITSNLLRNDKGQYFYWKAGVYMPEYLLTRNGRFTFYPFRTYAAGKYQGGYSDHLPVYLFLIREVN